MLTFMMIFTFHDSDTISKIKRKKQTLFEISFLIIMCAFLFFKEYRYIGTRVGRRSMFFLSNSWLKIICAVFIPFGHTFTCV